MSIGPLAPQGVRYLVPALEAATVDALRALRGRRDPVLWLRTPSGSLTDARGVTRFDVDTDRPGNGTPSGPEDMTVHVRAFLDAHARAMDVVHCVDDPSPCLGSERAVRLLQDFHEVITARDAVLLVAQAGRAGSRIAAYLERNSSPSRTTRSTEPSSASSSRDARQPPKMRPMPDAASSSWDRKRR